MTRKGVIFVILMVQVACAFFFVSDILISVIGVRTAPISWQLREMMEIGAAIGLLLGVVLGAVALRRTMQQSAHAQEKLRLASGAFTEVMNDRFAEWGLTPAERDVALFAIKGLSTQEIAALRNTSEGTVKAQTNAIYRKAGVSGRPQLLGLFIEDLLGDGLVPDQPAPSSPDEAA
ncbi:helix-turn-helix transcriptional regulator [Actibacterium sp. XHP0104]|uniref:helix-turn-helix transcriptional regulator n=1 Tax=Actibacterium sp. XHP0104 TaxID=2984335 RepID=UPI0021E8D34F|nr:LuxR C-terminal-related transcriptional regulator [Actibacterium sp. XHP0104]MCV2882174.1 LuxR C-terminal-related transcriptional regulator [Actibacterium sp. XHP0104]